MFGHKMCINKQANSIRAFHLRSQHLFFSEDNHLRPQLCNCTHIGCYQESIEVSSPDQICDLSTIT